MSTTKETERLEVEDKTDSTVLPILPLRDAVLFPSAVMPLNIGREKTLKLLEHHGDRSAIIGILAQKDKDIEDPSPDDMHEVGTTARILKTIKKSESSMVILVQGLRRFKVDEFVQEDPYLLADTSLLKEQKDRDTEVEALVQNLRTQATELLKLIPELPDSAQNVIEGIEDPLRLVYVIMAYIPVTVEEKMTILRHTDVKDAMFKTLEVLQHQLEVIRISQKIRSEVKGKMDQSQREFVLRQQLKAIQKELGEVDEENEVLEELREKIDKADMPDEPKKIADKELKRLRMIQPVSPEYTVIRTYLDWLTDMPWSKGSKDNLDIENARDILNRDHHDLEKVKKRILEYLAVSKLKGEVKGPILCFVGPPGVGKTSLGHSIAEALGREFIRMSLGGVRDESEIRGHRRTYIGAMPGRIVQGIKRAGTNNPLFMLDEIDKLGRDWRGDPTSALLEVLDPEQNDTFADHYLNVPFDLSKVMFVTTANAMETIPAPLLDRMEVIEIPGYTHDEKLMIAKRFLLKKQIGEHGLEESQLQVPDDILMMVIERYTREAGVRNLDRAMATICRQVAVGVVEGRWEGDTVVVDEDLLTEIMGPEKFQPEVSDRMDLPGVSTGLAKTSAGGEILFIEATGMDGKGKLSLTGSLGDVMKESAELAMAYLRSVSKRYGITNELFTERDYHIHVPAGAVPKDGPSAGVTLFTSLISYMSGIKVRPDIAMTGEISLRGLVLPVGGIRDKVLAALRNGIKTVILPDRNRKDIVDIPDEQREELTFIFAKTVDDVLRNALTEDIFERGASAELIENVANTPPS